MSVNGNVAWVEPEVALSTGVEGPVDVPLTDGGALPELPPLVPLAAVVPEQPTDAIGSKGRGLRADVKVDDCSGAWTIGAGGGT